MIEIPMNIDQLRSYVEKGKRFNEFRQRCVQYLAKHDQLVDKFTVNPNERLLGYVAERVLADSLPSLYPNCISAVERWHRQPHFDLLDLDERITGNDESPELVERVRAYFYDTWDLRLITEAGPIPVDVKTAVTAKEPASGWKFLYPVVQAMRGSAEDIVILAYCICKDVADPSTIQRVILVGANRKGSIRSCPRREPGEYTLRGVKSLIENFETSIATDYAAVDEVVCGAGRAE